MICLFFFEFQLDEEASYLAAFTSADRYNREAYIEKYSKFLTDPSIIMSSIRVDGVLVGSVAQFFIGSEAEVSYWIDKAYWNRGVATEALLQFLSHVKVRPLRGRVAFDHTASQRVLEKAGFKRIGEDRGYANARQSEITEYIYQLE